MDHSLKGSWWEAPSLEGLFFSGWLISHCLPLDASSINTEAALFLLTKWQTSWHIYLAHFLEENPKSSQAGPLLLWAHSVQSGDHACLASPFLSFLRPERPRPLSLNLCWDANSSEGPFPHPIFKNYLHLCAPNWSYFSLWDLPLNGWQTDSFLYCLVYPKQKKPRCWERLRAGEGATKDEMVGWHHRFNGLEFEQTPGDTEGQGSLACCSSWGCKEPDKIEQLNNNHPTQNVTSTEPGSLEFHLWYLGEWKLLGYSSKVWMKD